MSDHQKSSSSDKTVVGKGIKLRGELTGSAPIEVWGTLDGVAGTAKSLEIRPGGHVKGELAAAQVIIEGRVDGKIAAEQKVELKPTCEVRGDIKTPKMAIEEGAFFEGHIQMKDSKTGGA